MFESSAATHARRAHCRLGARVAATRTRRLPSSTQPRSRIAQSRWASGASVLRATLKTPLAVRGGCARYATGKAAPTTPAPCPPQLSNGFALNITRRAVQQSGRCWYSHESSGSLSTKVPDEHGWFRSGRRLELQRLRRLHARFGAQLAPATDPQNLTAATLKQISGAAGVLPVVPTPLFDLDLSSKLAFSSGSPATCGPNRQAREPSAELRGSSMSTVLKSPRAQDKGPKSHPFHSCRSQSVAAVQQFPSGYGRESGW